MYKKLPAKKMPNFDQLPTNLRLIIEDLSRNGSINIRCMPHEHISHYDQGQWKTSNKVLTMKEFKALIFVFSGKRIRQINDRAKVETSHNNYIYRGVYLPRRSLIFTIREKLTFSSLYGAGMGLDKYAHSLDSEPKSFSDLVLSKTQEMNDLR